MIMKRMQGELWYQGRTRGRKVGRLPLHFKLYFGLSALSIGPFARPLACSFHRSLILLVPLRSFVFSLALSLSLSLASELIGYCEVKCPIFKLFCTIVRWALSGGSHARNMRKNANDENALPITERPSDPTINRPNNQPTNRPNNQPTNQTERSID